MTEIWKPIIGYESRYEVSSDGNVRNIKTGRILKPTLQPPTSTRSSNTRYMKITLGQRDKFWLHRVVAKAYIPNPDNKGQVDHIDGNGTNNKASNLRWVTQSENMSNSTTMRRAKRSKLVNGKTYAEISRTLGDKYGRMVSKRIRRGWCIGCATTVSNSGIGGDRRQPTCGH